MKDTRMPDLRLRHVAVAATLMLSAIGLGACESSAGKGAAIGAAGGAAAGLVTGQNVLTGAAAGAAAGAAGGFVLDMLN